jgi:hypothetical protein
MLNFQPKNLLFPHLPLRFFKRKIDARLHGHPMCERFSLDMASPTESEAYPYLMIVLPTDHLRINDLRVFPVNSTNVSDRVVAKGRGDLNVTPKDNDREIQVLTLHDV